VILLSLDLNLNLFFCGAKVNGRDRVCDPAALNLFEKTHLL